MNKITIFLLFFAWTYIASQTVDYSNTEPYHDFDWLDEDEYTITVAYTSSNIPSTCCLANGTKVCAGTCSAGTNSISCKFTGAECGGDPDNPSTKYYYDLYCGTTCTKDTDVYGTSSGLTTAEVTVAISAENYIKFSFILLLSLLVL